MNDDLEIEEAVRRVIMDVLLVLHKHGIKEVHMGGLMRVVGVTDEAATEHDNEILEITEEFAKYMKYITERPAELPGDKTIH